MTEQESLIWDVTRSDNLAFLNYYPSIRDRAALIGAASSLDGNGVCFDVLSPAEFLAHFGTVPKHLLVPMQDANRSLRLRSVE